MSKKKIAIIIVTFNSEKYIAKCIESIFKNRLVNYEINILIIDNKSIDKTLQKIMSFPQNYLKKIKVISNSENFGFAKAVNMGIKKEEKSDYFLLLNPDTILNYGSLKKLIDCSIKCKTGITGGITLDEKNVQSGSFFRFPNIFVGLYDFTNLRKLYKNDFWHNYFYYKDKSFLGYKCFDVDVVTGGYMLITKSTIKKNGLFDEHFFMYLEDVDFCLRAKKNGIKTSVCFNSKIYHKGGASSNNKDRIRHTSWLWSRKWYFFKNFSIIENIVIQPIFLLDDLFILFKKIFPR